MCIQAPHYIKVKNWFACHWINKYLIPNQNKSHVVSCFLLVTRFAHIPGGICCLVTESLASSTVWGWLVHSTSLMFFFSYSFIALVVCFGLVTTHLQCSGCSTRFCSIWLHPLAPLAPYCSEFVPLANKQPDHHVLWIVLIISHFETRWVKLLPKS